MKANFFSRQGTILILGFALITMMFNSCKKDDAGNGGEYFIRFKANGTQVDFAVQGSLTAAFGQAGSQFNAVFSGGDATSNISLQVFDNKAIAEANYTGYGIVGSSVVGALIGYSDKTGTLYTQGAVGSNATITVTELAATTVRGTFGGIVKATGKPDILITQGEFFVWRAN